jgi:hypothetical protein
MMDLWEKYGVDNARATAVIHEFEDQMENSEKAKQLYDE